MRARGVRRSERGMQVGTARYLFVWVALLGAALGVERGVHFLRSVLGAL